MLPWAQPFFLLLRQMRSSTQHLSFRRPWRQLLPVRRRSEDPAGQAPASGPVAGHAPPSPTSPRVVTQRTHHRPGATGAALGTQLVRRTRSLGPRLHGVHPRGGLQLPGLPEGPFLGSDQPLPLAASFKGKPGPGVPRGTPAAPLPPARAKGATVFPVFPAPSSRLEDTSGGGSRESCQQFPQLVYT